MASYHDIGRLVIDLDRVVALQEPNVMTNPPKPGLLWLDGLTGPLEISVGQYNILRPLLKP